MFLLQDYNILPTFHLYNGQNTISIPFYLNVPVHYGHNTPNCIITKTCRLKKITYNKLIRVYDTKT